MNTYTERFFKRGRDFLQVETPIMCGAMTWVSDPQLVAAVAKFLNCANAATTAMIRIKETAVSQYSIIPTFRRPTGASHD